MTRAFWPPGETSSMSMSSGNVWVRPFRDRLTSVIVPWSPLTTLLDGYGAAGAPVDAPVPVAGMVIGFTNNGATATCPADEPMNTTTWMPGVVGAGMVFEPNPLAFVVPAPWLTPSMKTVPVWLGANRSYRNTKFADSVGKEAGELMADGVLTAFGSPWKVILATRALVAPVRTHCAAPVPPPEVRKKGTAPLAFAGSEAVAQPVMLTVSPGWKPSPETPIDAPPAEGMTGRSTRTRVRLLSPAGGVPASARSSSLWPAMLPTVAV
jgi:hypothetical protein